MNPVRGRDRNLPETCDAIPCGELTANILILGCLEQHICEYYRCPDHTVGLIDLVRAGMISCDERHLIVAYKQRGILWLPEMFRDRWVLQQSGKVIAVNSDPDYLVKRLRELPSISGTSIIKPCGKDKGVVYY